MAPRRKMNRRQRRKMNRKYPISRGLGGVPDVASLTESITNRNPNSPFYTTNQNYRLYNVSLQILPRAVQVAQAYQEFRIRRITVVYKAGADTFVLNPAGTLAAAPQLYYIVDKKAAVPSNFTIDTLTQMGATPKRFDDNLRKISWAPAVLQSSLTDPAALSTSVAAAQISPWLPTNGSPGQTAFVASDVDHLGLSWMAFVPGGAAAVGYDVDVIVDVEYRKPRFNAPSPSSPQALDWNHKTTV